MSSVVALAGWRSPADEPRVPWPQFLESNLDFVWREDEWDPEALEFTGNPTNPMTGVNVCATPRCTTLIDGSKVGRCLKCRRERRIWTGGDFDAEYVPVRQRVGGAPATPHTFTLADLTSTARNEVLAGLQFRDREGIELQPVVARSVVRMVEGAESVLDVRDEGAPARTLGLLRAIQANARRLRARHAGRDGTEGEVWDCALVGLRSARDRPYTAATGFLDFTVVRQTWLRHILLETTRALRPSVAEVRHTLQAASIASLSLAGRPNGETPSALSMGDMTAIFDAFRHAVNPATTKTYSSSHRVSLWGAWRRLIETGRRAGLMDEVPGTFAIPDDKRMPVPAAREDELGSAIPEAWIAHLDAHLDALGTSTTYTANEWSAGDFALLYQAIYQLLRDTGRRPSEITGLRRDPLEFSGAEASLIYDNRKAGRHGRRLPITSSTVDVVRAWSNHLGTLQVPDACADFLFPAPGPRNRARRGHLSSAQFSKVFRSWVEALDTPVDLPPEARAFAKTEIGPYGLRHAYAQRHADNGTPVDVLRELMDHVSIETTMGYFTVSLRRKQEAVRLMSQYSIDRFGHPAPFANDLAYERSSVAVPFGNCTEPTNVAAGGKSCPIRFQCAGCGYYRPDPSYLDAVAKQIRNLRTDRELAIGADAAQWVVTNLDEQIAAFVGVAESLQAMIAAMPPQELANLDEAGATMRKVRQTQVFIPLDDVGHRE
ncbi:tyrosine-type recombinase/integrase [Brachybacterium sacelli]|uniref:Integrase n=1 Tax=Brachybacterium sacelli TaxID=173364 RepID=A0ABS4X1H1_9MICO|nr:tyrosine-type recombinase/integrase [Brachybacterium sacelli]MBP2382309.1 integrase [Brachybacterium sacelli]